MIVDNQEEHHRLYAAVGLHIKAAREQAGISQAELAKRLGVSRASVVNIERGRQRPPLHVLWEIARSLAVKTTDLIPNAAELNSDSMIMLTSGRNSKVGEELTKYINTIRKEIRTDENDHTGE